MNDQQKFTVSYGRDPSMDLPEAGAAAEFAQYLEDLRKVDPSIPPMPEGDTSDPLSPASRWWCEHFWFPLLAEDAKDKAKRVPAVWKALRLVALHRLPPPEWLASEMLADDFPTLPRKNAAALFVEEIERFHAVVSAIYGVQRAAEKEGIKLGIEKIVGYKTNIPEKELARMPQHLKKLLKEAEDILTKGIPTKRFRANSTGSVERMLGMFKRFNEACDRLP